MSHNDKLDCSEVKEEQHAITVTPTELRGGVVTGSVCLFVWSQASAQKQLSD